MAKPIPLQERLYRKLNRTEGGCWNWLGAKMPNGYGEINEGPPHFKPRSIHRVSYEIHHGPIPEGLQVLHRCDNRACANPEHLFLGTNLDNRHDSMRKERTVRKLNRQKVLEIRELLEQGLTQRQIASQFGVNQTIISDINLRKGYLYR
jgi:hypothetical protein